MTSFHFRRSWGADPIDGGARFAIWAPHEESVAVRASAGPVVPMNRAEDGWWMLESDHVAIDEGYSFALGSGRDVADPAARAQVGDVHGPSRLVDPRAHVWRVPDWKGRPWEEAVVYELHTGTFTDEGTFDGIVKKLPYLADLGVTAIELMPVAQFSGDRGWGYDGVLLYAPHRAYGGPEGLKRLVDAAHEQGLMVLLDVVYNHFGPDGNYLPTYAPDFFDRERQTPWGDAIAFERDPVRRFFVENPLHWLAEYRLDGLRFDAIDQIRDPSDEPVLKEMARRIRDMFPDRHIHLCTEDDRNIVELHPRDADGRPTLFTAEWNDDFHHVGHVAATGEDAGYYRDFTIGHARMMARALATGFVYQGEPSVHLARERGVPSDRQPPTAFVNFNQNHDQIGNRACGDRLTVLAEPRPIECLMAILLLAPQIPMLFMGEEWGDTRPFLFFTDFHGELADAVREGRRGEFKDWPDFSDPEQRRHIPDPNNRGTCEASKPDWTGPEGAGAGRLAFTRGLLRLRHAEIAPRLVGMGGGTGRSEVFSGGAFAVNWTLGDGTRLELVANIAADPQPARAPRGRLLFESDDFLRHRLEEGAALPGWSAVWTIEEAPATGQSI